MFRYVQIIFGLSILAIVGGTPYCFAAEKFGEVFEVEGSVTIMSPEGRTISLRQDKHLFYPVREGDRIEVVAGKVTIVSSNHTKGYELTSGTVVEVRKSKIIALRGNMTVKEGLQSPPRDTGGTIGGTVMRGMHNSTGDSRSIESPSSGTSEIVLSGRSTITESGGYACMGDDKSRKQTEQIAMADAKRNAAEKVLSYIKSETSVKDMELQKDIVSSYSNATVKVLEELQKGWYRDQSAGDCFKVSIKAEIIPDEKAIKSLSKNSTISDNPDMPLKVSVWTGKDQYKQGEKIKIFIRGNKPFYANVLYKDSKSAMLQLLPNPFRSDNYFNGGMVYEIPSGNDRFELEVEPPFGDENIIVYASTSQLGDLSLESEGGIYKINTKTANIGATMRGVKLKGKSGEADKSSAEFYEDVLPVKTLRQ